MKSAENTTTNGSPLPEEKFLSYLHELIAKAERWDGLMGCSRIRWMGSAGFNPERRQQNGDPEDYRHAEFGIFTTYWTEKSQENDIEKANRLQAIALLTEMADVMRVLRRKERQKDDPLDFGNQPYYSKDDLLLFIREFLQAEHRELGARMVEMLKPDSRFATFTIAHSGAGVATGTLGAPGGVEAGTYALVPIEHFDIVREGGCRPYPIATSRTQNHD